MTKESRRRLTAMETSNDISPYRLPVINNFVVTPVPPATKRKERGLKVTPGGGGMLRGRRLRPTTATSGANITEVSISVFVVNLNQIEYQFTNTMHNIWLT